MRHGNIYKAIAMGLAKGTLSLFGVGKISRMVGSRLAPKSISGAMFSKNSKLNRLFKVKPAPTIITVQKHNARKAGLHYDFRVRSTRSSTQNRLISFVFKKKPPSHFTKKPGQSASKNFSTKIIRTQDHKVDWEDFEGEIEEGYGAGSVEIDYQSPGIAWLKPGRLHIYSPYNENPWSGHWTFVEITKDHFTAIREAAFPDVWVPRPSYSDVPPENIGSKLKENASLIAERKVDGANFIVKFNSPGLTSDTEIINSAEGPLLSKGEQIVRTIKSSIPGLKVFKIQDKNHNISYKVSEAAEVKTNIDPAKIAALREAFSKYADIDIPEGTVPGTFSIVSRRISSAGFPIHREGNAPHLAFAVLPDKFVNKVFRAELWHPDGVTFLSGTLNSGYDKAALAQQKHGFIRMMIFDYEGTQLDDTFIPSPLHYTNRRNFYESLVRELNNMRYGHNRLTRVSSEGAGFFSVPDKIEGNVDKINEFYKKVTGSPLPLGEGLVIKDPNEPARIQRWLKMKKTNTFDLKIKEILPGTGKYANAAGKVVVVDRTGTEVAKVGGGFSDQERLDMWKHPNKYIGKVIEVRAQNLAKEALRAPRFIRWRDDKNPSDIDIVPVASHEDIIKNYLKGSGLTNSEIDDAYYAVKVAAGWRPNR